VRREGCSVKEARIRKKKGGVISHLDSSIAFGEKNEKKIAGLKRIPDYLEKTI